MKSEIIKMGGRDTLHYIPAKETSNVIVGLHGTGEKTFADLRSRGLGAVAENTEINAHIYLVLYNGGYPSIDNVLVPLENAIIAKHGGITLGTGFSAGGSMIYKWLTSGKTKMKKAVPIATNSSTSDMLGAIAGAPEVDLWHLHGQNDGSPNQLVTSEGFIKAYNLLYPGKAKRTVFSGKGHDVWTLVYNSLLSTPTMTGNSSLYAPFDKSIFDWALGAVPEPPVDPPVPQPIQDPIVESYIETIGEEKTLVFKTKSGARAVITL